MRCPRCELEQPDAVECAGCGVVIARAGRKPRSKPPADGGRPTRSGGGFTLLVGGATLALVLAMVLTQRQRGQPNLASGQNESQLPETEVRPALSLASAGASPTEAPVAATTASPSPAAPRASAAPPRALDLRDIDPATITEAAIRKLQAELSRRPDDLALRVRLARSLTAMGERLRREGDHRLALTYLERALVHDPGHGFTLLSMASTQLALERFAAADRSLEALDPETAASAAYHVVLGDLRYQQERLEEALDALRFAEALAGTDELAPRIARIERELAALADGDGARKLESRRFEVHFEGNGNAAIGRLVLQALEAVYTELRPHFAMPDFTVKTILYSNEDYRSVTGAPHWAAAIYDGKIRLPVGGLQAIDDQFRRTIKHEMTHAFIARKGGDAVPRWLHEGLAEWHEGRRTTDRALTALERHAIAQPMMSTDVRLFYLQALHRVEVMMERYGNRKVLGLLDSMRRGQTFDGALRRVANQHPERFFGSFAE